MPVERTSIPGEPLPRPRPFWPRCDVWPAAEVACGDELPPQLETAITAQSKHMNENGFWIRKLDLAPLFSHVQRNDCGAESATPVVAKNGKISFATEVLGTECEAVSVRKAGNPEWCRDAG